MSSRRIHFPLMEKYCLHFIIMAILLSFAYPCIVAHGASDRARGGVSELSPSAIGEMPEEVKKFLEENPELLKKSVEQGESPLKKEFSPEIPDKAGEEVFEAEKKEKKYRWQDSIYVKKLFFDRFLESEMKPLVHFAHDLFDREKGKFAPLTTLPISPEYIVGPGDEVLISLWGRMEGRYTRRVDREGKIYLPKFGTLYVAGKTYKELKQLIADRVGVVTGANVDVTVTDLKGIKVFILGEVNSPGGYNVTSFHTAIQALYTGGGVKDTGSLRDIRVIRKGKTVRHIDIYKLLLEGNTKGDIPLIQGDTLFVPIVKSLVAVTGEVKRQGIFELKKGEQLKALINMAGGFSPTAYKKRLQVERLYKNSSRIVLDVDVDELAAGKKGFPMKDGDIVRVKALFRKDINAVTLKGNVYNPGKYELKEGMKLRDILPDQFAFLPETYFDYAVLIRLVPPDMHRKIISVNLTKAILEKVESANVPLKPYDRVLIFSRKDFRDLPLATISGQVRNPGKYEVKEGMRISDLIRLSGDLKKTAYHGRGEVVRIQEDRTLMNLYFDVNQAMEHDPVNDFPLMDEDHVIIRAHPNASETIFVKIEGEVKFPGYYGASKGERLSSVIDRAGGFKEDAYLKGIVFTREGVKKVQQERINRLIKNLEHKIAIQSSEEIVGIIDPDDVKIQKELLRARQSLLTKLRSVQAKGRIVIHLAEFDKFKGSDSDLVLEDGDTLTVPKHMNVINVIGEVYNPTAVTYNAGEKDTGYYLDLVGGPTDSADEKEIFVIKADGSVLSKKNVESIRSAELDPGDTIAVPEEIVKTRAIKDVKDITQIMFQIAVTAGVIIAAF